MRLFITLIGLVTAMLITAPSMAEDPLASQINTLILTIEDSGCHFIRNGKTYTPVESVAHIKRKYNYYKGDIDSIDKFIELSASKSLISGKPYYVMCDDKERQVSATWLTMKATALGIKQ
jgi:hypothetical protein